MPSAFALAMLTPGDVVGPYEIRGFVGQGGMGQVYRAFDPRLERTVALKVIVPPASAAEDGDEAGRRDDSSLRLLREARAVASLSHPNVVAIYDVGESNGRLYLAMEYVVGSTLRALVGQPDVPLARKIRWLVDVARALDAAHRSGLVHRDVKPENVMVREDGGVKVLDFGIARRTRIEGSPHEAEAVDTVTGGGAIAGTPVYMAPEQIKGGEIDARCDQFAWAVTAYELLAGERPWPESPDMLSLVAKVLTDPPRPLRARVVDVPAVVEETIVRALAKDPAARFASMADVADALEPFGTATTGGDRIRITPAPVGSPAPTASPGVPGALGPRDDPAAFAATTRLPAAHVETTTPHTPAAARSRRGVRLAVPLLLLGALGGVVAWVRRTHVPAPVTSVVTANAPASSVPTPRPLSPIPQAEISYREAMSSWRDGATAKSSAALKRAIELDPTFAAAHLELAIQMSSVDPALAQAAFQGAFENRQMLLARDAALLEASVPYVRPKPDLDEWVTRMTAVVFQYPRDPELQYYLGRAHERLGDDEAARGAYEASVRLDERFIPGIAALAHVQSNLGQVKQALAATQRCMELSPIASTCLETRYDILVAANDCHRAREEATQWAALEPQSPWPADALARALFADGAPRPAVDEALSRKWSLLAPGVRKQKELIDRVQLAVVDGDLGRAEELAREFEAALSLSADRADRAVPARLRVAFLTEMDRTADAAKVARSYLDRMAAWQTYPFAPDPSIEFYEPLFRTGELTSVELEQRRREWLAHEKRRVGDRDPRAGWATWTAVYGGFAETREEALDALARRPKTALPPETRRPLMLDFALGKALVLADKPADGIPHLQRVLGTCAALDASLLMLRARWYLGQAHEARNDFPAARAAYEAIVHSSPKPSASRTVKRAEERLGALVR